MLGSLANESCEHCVLFLTCKEVKIILNRAKNGGRKQRELLHLFLQDIEMFAMNNYWSRNKVFSFVSHNNVLNESYPCNTSEYYEQLRHTHSTQVNIISN
jgi:hypothetical protein